VRILLANSFHYRRGGDSAQFLDLAAGLEEGGHEIAVFAMKHPLNLSSEWSDYWAPHVEYRGQLSLSNRIHAAYRSVRSAESGRAMTRLIRDFGPHAVHFHSVQHQLTMSAVEACLAEGVPIVWTLHDYRCVCPATSLLRGDTVCERCTGGRFWHGVAGRCKSGEWSRSVAAAAESYVTRVRRPLPRVGCYVAPSRFLARKVIQMGLPAQRMEVVPNPVLGPAMPRETCARQGLLYVGRLSVEKGVDLLIRAVAESHGERLRIVGDGPDVQRLKALANQLHADVVFEGWTDAHGVQDQMAQARLLCVPSVCYENCPGVVLEAMAAGLPVVASNLGGLIEQLDGGRAGWLVPAGNSDAWRHTIREALRDRPRTTQQAARALDLVRCRNNPERFIERIESIYRSVAN
jgi:glycosyltransferase involved in cell wall biosynthesis